MAPGYPLPKAQAPGRGAHAYGANLDSRVGAPESAPDEERNVPVVGDAVLEECEAEGIVRTVRWTTGGEAPRRRGGCQASHENRP
jgi:hypothetical protein